ncbi:11307_t:CDS:2, partial [Acaulospora colombiana]
YLRAVDVEKIHKTLMDLWEEDLDAGTGTLWRTCEWLRSGTFLEDIGLAEPLQPIRLVHPRPVLLAERLKEYNNTVKFNTFSQSKFDCQICLSSVKGAQCIRLDCLHVFCRPCLTDFWSLCIAEGDVDRVMCADPQCVKDGRPVTEDEVLRVVSESETRRWKELRRKRALEKDPGLIYCPIAFCQSPCPTPQVQRDAKDRDSESMDDVAMRRKYLSLRTCDNCEFAFCILCKRAWHGLAPCSSDITTRFLEEYISLSDDDPEKLALELRFGKAQLKRLVAVFQEDQENKKWLRESTTQCPHCQ